MVGVCLYLTKRNIYPFQCISVECDLKKLIILNEPSSKLNHSVLHIELNKVQTSNHYPMYFYFCALKTVTVNVKNLRNQQTTVLFIINK